MQPIIYDKLKKNVWIKLLYMDHLIQKPEAALNRIKLMFLF